MTCFISGQWASAQTPVTGELDASFGDEGIVMATPAGYGVKTFDAAVQADGGLVMVGEASAAGSSPKMVICRLTSAGEVDGSFGSEGFSFYAPNAERAYAARAVVALPNGKIMVAGDHGTTFTVIRLLADGSLDGSFTPVNLNQTYAARLTDLDVNANGQIVLCGQVARDATPNARSDAVIWRLSPDGSVNGNFASGGLYKVEKAAVRWVTFLPGSKILFAGAIYSGEGFISQLSEIGGYQADMSVLKGRVEKLAADPSGLWVAVVSHPRAGGLSGRGLSLVRVNGVGSYDSMFAGQDCLNLPLDGDATTSAGVAVQADGRILICGRQPSEAGGNIELRRFDWNGQADASFGESGRVVYPIGTAGAETAFMSLVGDGKLVIAGTAQSATGQAFAALRAQTGDLAPTPVITITEQPESKSAHYLDPVQLTVKVESNVPPVYLWHRGEYTFYSTSPNFEVSSVDYWDAGTYYVEVRVGTVKVTSKSVTLAVHYPPSFAPGTLPFLAAPLNGDAILSIPVYGDRPMTCRWFKNGEEYLVQEYLPRLIFDKVKASDAGIYRLEASNAHGQAVSQDVHMYVVRDPDTFATRDALVSVGQEFVLDPGYYSSLPEYTLQWKKDGKAVEGLETGAYGREAATLADGGAYTVTIKSRRGSATSVPMKVGVVDLRARTHTAGVGKKFQLVLPVTGPGMSFVWSKGGVPLTKAAEAEGVSGWDKPTLAFKSVRLADAADYTCTITLGAMQLSTEPQTLLVTDATPVLEVFTLPATRVGVAYDVPLPLPTLANHFEVKDLPAGLVYVKDGHRLVGSPTKAGDFAVTFTALNPVGASTSLQVSLEILPISQEIAGRFYGVLGNNGILDLTVTESGTYSGKVSLGALNGKVSTAALTGTLTASVPEGDLGAEEEPGYVSTTTCKLKGFAPSVLPTSVSIVVGHGVMDVQLGVPYTDQGVEGVEEFYSLATLCPYSAKAPLEDSYCGQFNLGFSGSGDWRDVPAGHGYALAKITPAGALSLAGKLADGTALTSSAPVNKNHEGTGMKHLYSNRGVLAYLLTLNAGTLGPDYLDAAVSGQLTWQKISVSSKGQKNYPSSFSTSMSVLGGAKYLRPNHPSETVGPLMMNVGPGPNAEVDVSVGNDGSRGSLSSNHGVTFDNTGENNPVGLKPVKFNASTGLFTGSGTIVTTEEIYNPARDSYSYKTNRKSYSIQGMVIRKRTEFQSRSVGLALMPESVENRENGKMEKLTISLPVVIE